MSSLNLGRSEFGDPSDSGKLPSREEAFGLFREWVVNPRLQLHMLQVAALMRAWAQKKGLDEASVWKWEVSGLLHDADWDQWPDQHCRKIIGELERRHLDPEIMHAIASHGPLHFGVEPRNEMDKMLFAFDELSGLIHAYSLMRPDGYEGMDVKGVKKRLKEKSFAANVSRDDIADACRRADITPEDLIAFIIPVQSEVTPEIT